MVDTHDEDDLFQHTSMTFGEHLEELRGALLKAVIALAIGFVIGLSFAATTVRWIQTPLEIALRKYYKNEAMAFVNARVPPELQDNPAIKELVETDGLLPEVRYFSRVELIEALERQPSKAPATNAREAAADANPDEDASPEGAKVEPARELLGRQFSQDQMVKLFVWRQMDDDERIKLDALSVQEPFVIYIKAGFLAGAVLASPAVFYFLWQFVAAGLYPHEKRYVHLFLPFSVGLFLCGAMLAFFFVFPPVLGFFFGIAKALGAEMRPRLNEWLSFVLLLPLGFGIGFQLPLVMLFLERIHVFTVQTYLSKWRIAVLVIAVISTVLSPPDPFSMLMMLVPLVGLYFGGIALCKWLPPPKRRMKG